MAIKRIKKYKNNEYALTEHNIWVRNSSIRLHPIDINNLTSEKDYKLFIDNETYIRPLNLMAVNEIKNKYKNCVIVSDGLNFLNAQSILKQIKGPYIVIGINGALKKWNASLGKMDFYLVNNPYQECCSFLPKNKYFPPCIVASRTSSEFVKKYKGIMYKYYPTYESKFSMFNNTTGFRIDDYRSPLCAALNIANFFQSSNILLLSCDNAFADERPGSEKLENNMYSYPQHKISQEIVDTMAFFMKRENPEIKIGDCSNGWKYDNISNISNVSEFFI